MTNFTEFEAFFQVPGSETGYWLVAPVIWDIGAKNSGWTLTIDAGTRFDLSVPRCLRWALNPHDRRILLAAAVHDELLVRGHDAAFASAEFRRAAIARGVSRPTAWVLFFATLVWTALRAPKTAKGPL